MGDRKIGNDPSFNRVDNSDEFGVRDQIEAAPAESDQGCESTVKAPVDEIVSGALEAGQTETENLWKLEKAIESPTAKDVMLLIKEALESIKEGGGKEDDAAYQFEAFKESFLKRAAYLRTFALLLKSGSDSYEALCASFFGMANQLLPKIQEYNRRVGIKTGSGETETAAVLSFFRAFKQYQKKLIEREEFFLALEEYNAFALERNREIGALTKEIDLFNADVAKKNREIEELNTLRMKLGVGPLPLLPRLELPEPMQVVTSPDYAFANVGFAPRREISVLAIDNTGKLTDDVLENWIPNLKSDLMFLSAKEGKDEIESHFADYMKWLHLPWDQSFHPELSLNVLKNLRKEGGLPYYLNLLDSSMMPYLGTGMIDYVLKAKLPDYCRVLSEDLRLLIIDLIAQAGVMSSTPALLMALEHTPDDLNRGVLDLIVSTAFAKSVRSIIASSLIEESVEKIIGEKGLHVGSIPEGELIKPKLIAVCNLTLAFAAVNRIASALKLPGLSARVLSEALQHAGIKGFHPRLTLKEVLSNGAFDIAIAKSIKEKLLKNYHWAPEEADGLVTGLFSNLSKEAFWKHGKDSLIPLIALNLERAGLHNGLAAKAIAFQVYSEILSVVPSETLENDGEERAISALLVSETLINWHAFNPPVDKEKKEKIKMAAKALLSSIHNDGETHLLSELTLRLAERIEKEGIEKSIAKEAAESIGGMVLSNLEARGTIDIPAAEVRILLQLLETVFVGYSQTDLIKLPIFNLIADCLSLMKPKEITDRLLFAMGLPGGDDASHAFLSMELKIPFEWIKAAREQFTAYRVEESKAVASIAENILTAAFSSSKPASDKAVETLGALFKETMTLFKIRLADELYDQGIERKRAESAAASIASSPYALRSQFDLRKALYMTLILLGETLEASKGAALAVSESRIRLSMNNLREDILKAWNAAGLPKEIVSAAADVFLSSLPFLHHEGTLDPWQAGVAKLLFATGAFSPSEALKIADSGLSEEIAALELQRGFKAFFVKSLPREEAERLSTVAAGLLLETMDAFTDEREFARKIDEIALFLTGVSLSSKEAVLAGLRLNAVLKGGALKARMDEAIKRKSPGELEADLLASKAMINLFALQMPLQQAFGMSEIALSTDKVIRTKVGVLEKKLEGMLLAEGVDKSLSSRLAHLSARETLQESERFSGEKVFKEVLFASLQGLFEKVKDEDHFFEKPNAAAELVSELAITELMRREILQEDLRKILERADYAEDKAFFTASDMADSLFRSPHLFEDEKVFASAVRNTFIAWGLVDEAVALKAVASIEFGLIIHGSPLRTLDQSGNMPLPALIRCFLAQSAEENRFLKWGSEELVRELLLLVFGAAAAGEQIKYGSSDPSLLKIVKDNFSLIISARKENKIRSGLKKVLAEFARSLAHPTLEYFILLTKATKPAEAIISSTHLTLNSREKKEAEIKKALNNVV